MMLFLDANALGLSHLDMGTRFLTALLGYAVVFAGLLMLMAIVYIMGAIFKSLANKKAQAPALPKADKQAPVQAIQKTLPPAPGTAGEIKLFDVPDKEAALIMAIVADQMGKPLNELRFKSIKEVK